MARVGYGGTFGFFIGLASIILASLFVYKSVAQVMVLGPEPPAEYLNVQSSWTAKQRQSEEKLARAYWETARTLSRAAYHFTDRLPDDPPGAFSVDAKSYPSVLEPASSARARYWRNLQKVWNDPNNWETTYEWHTGWLTGRSY
ncbi:MAG: hypothetical protein HY508_07925 [Acidobacteria bacterium]|nr:hypothetical protein [Acidobacteriota bacterium]